MSLSSVNHLPIEYITLDATVPLALMILGLFQFFLCIILDWDSKIYSFFLGSMSSSTSTKDKGNHLKDLQVKVERKKSDLESSSNKHNINEEKQDESICREEVEVVMESLGLFGRPEPESAGKLQERFDCNDLCNLFEEKEPTQEEVKTAFDVFDENKDGFIDAKELQRLLCSLGLKEGFELENCRKMIRAFDENGDERIDFHEFVKFIEKSFC